MPNSIYGGTFPSNKMRLTILAAKGLTGCSGTSCEGTPGGHTYIAFEWQEKSHHRHIVYHLVGARGSSSGGSGHLLLNRSSVERLMPPSQAGSYLHGYVARPGRNFVSIGGLNPFSRAIGVDNPANDTPAGWMPRGMAHTSINVRLYNGRNALKICNAYANNARHPKLFSLIGANIKLGTNCFTFALMILAEAGVQPDWTMYLLSFVSPYQAIIKGGLQ